VNHKIKKATNQDLPILNSISVKSKMHWGYPQEWIRNWMDILTITPEYLEKNFVYKILVNEIIGFCGIEKKSNYYEIGHLWILPDFIGKGYGKYLLEKTISTVVPKGSELRVEADPNAEAFYKRMGFSTFDKVESFPKGRYLPLMKKYF